jgi:hypothetical protein
MGNTQKSWLGAPTTNIIPNAGTMLLWQAYYRTTAAPAFITEFGTTGYRLANQPSWNGVQLNVAIPSAGTYTFSAWFRYNGGSASNNGATVYVAGWGGGDAATVLNKNLIGVWQRVSLTLTVTTTNIIFYLISYGGTDNGTGNPDWSSWDVTMPQIELGSYATPFVNGTRIANSCIKDVSANSSVTIVPNSLTYNNDNTFSFNGSSNYATIAMNLVMANNISQTWECWVTPGTQVQNYVGIFGHVVSGGCTYYCDGGICIWNGNYAFCWFDDVSYQFLDSGVPATAGVDANISCTYDATDGKPRIYVNGILKNTWAGATNMNYGGYANISYIGYFSASNAYYTGKIGVIRHYYNKALNITEVQQNFNALRGRYGV